MEKYFRLSEGVFLVRGAKRYALYDTVSGLVYSLNADAVEVLRKVFSGIGSNEDYQFARLLETMNLIIATDDSFSVLSPKDIFEDIEQYRLEFVWIELTNRCNLKCIHCYANSGIDVDTKNELTIEEWSQVLYDVFSAGARYVQFIGGEPLLYKGFEFLIAKASEIGFEKIEIFTNGMLVKDKLLKKLKSYSSDISFALSLYSHNAYTHDTITMVKGSWSKTIRAIKQIRKHGFPVRVEMIVMRQNQNDVEQTMRLIQSLGAYSRDVDVIRPSGRGNQALLPTKPEVLSLRIRAEPDFSTNLVQFKKSLYWNSCWAGKLAITSNGKVIPCIFARQIILGSVKTKSIVEILHSDLLISYWRLSKDKINICKDCEYRYACHDCRPLVMASGHGIFDKTPFCTYDPYTGKWQDDVSLQDIYEGR